MELTADAAHYTQAEVLDNRAWLSDFKRAHNMIPSHLLPEQEYVPFYTRVYRSASHFTYRYLSNVAILTPVTLPSSSVRTKLVQHHGSGTLMHLKCMLFVCQKQSYSSAWAMTDILSPALYHFKHAPALPRSFRIIGEGILPMQQGLLNIHAKVLSTHCPLLGYRCCSYLMSGSASVPHSFQDLLKLKGD